MCWTRSRLHGGNVEKSVERPGRRSTYEPHMFLTLISLATSTCFTRGPTPYKRHINSSMPLTMWSSSSVHVKPTAANMCINFEFWLNNLIGLTSPLPLKAEVQSAPVKACTANQSCNVFLGIVISQLADVDQLLSCIHKNVDRERFGICVVML